MDLEEEGSVSGLEIVREDRVEESLQKVASLDEIGVQSNGELGHEEVSGIQSKVGTGDGDSIGEVRGRGSLAEATIISDHGSAEGNGDMVGELLAESHWNSIGSPLSSALTPGAVKGFGLKKWRRIRRDLNKDGSPGADSSVFHKRRLPLAEQKATDDSRNPTVDEAEGKGGGSTSSAESTSVVGAPPVVCPSPPMALNPELELLAASNFAIGIDSENSEDRSGKSSVAANAPRLRHEIGFGRERRGIRSVGGRGSGHIIQHKSHRARGGSDVNKKNMEYQAKIEKENSSSSVESDFRISNAASGSSVINGKKSKLSINYGQECGDAHPTEEVRSDHSNENCGMEDLPGENLDANILDEQNQGENSRSESYVDPVSESITSLQAAQEALEIEIQNFEEIGKETMLDASDDDSIENEESSSVIPDAHLSELKQKIEQLENKLGDALATVIAKEAKIHELEVNLSVARNEDRESVDICSLQQSRKELNIELENLIKKKIEAEIECLAITQTTRDWKILQEEHMNLVEEQKILAQNQMKMLHKLKIAENKAVILKAHAEELDAYCKDLLHAQGVLKLQSKVCQYCLCCFVQLVMLSVAFSLFVSRIMPPSTSDFVPT